MNDVRRVALVGPESVGKSTLAEHLAREFDTVWVPEYGRLYCETIPAMELTLADYEAIAWGQATWEDEAAPRANGVLICDTDLHTTATWADMTLGTRPAWLTAVAAARPYDLFLMLEPDVPFIQDDVRVLGDRRLRHAQLIRAELARARRRVVSITGGDWETRAQAARLAVAGLLDEKR